MVRCYPTTCRRPDCEHESWQDVPADEPRLSVGDDVACDCGDDSTVALVMPRAIGILTEHYDPQTKQTFRSNRHYQDWLKYGNPITNEAGEVVGHRQIREYSHAELDAMSDAGWAQQEEIARANGMTLEQAAQKEVAAIAEKRTREIEAGLKPTVGLQKAADLLPA